MTQTRVTQYQRGYQEALADVLSIAASQGAEAAIEYAEENLR